MGTSITVRKPAFFGKEHDMINLDIEIRQCDGWVAVYVGGVKRYEGHSIEPKTLLETLGLSYNYVWFDREDPDDFPASLDRFAAKR
jgi:hypothetical protein